MPARQLASTSAGMFGLGAGRKASAAAIMGDSRIVNRNSVDGRATKTTNDNIDETADSGNQHAAGL